MGCSTPETIEKKENKQNQKENEEIRIILPNYEENVNNFIKQRLKNTLDYDYRNIDDRKNNPYYQLKKLEIEKLGKKFLDNKSVFNEVLNNCPQLYLNLDQNLISKIIQREKGANVYNEKIINKIKEFKNDKDKFKIEYLTALLVGKRKIGKKN